MIEILIKENESEQRLDRFLKKYMDKAPNSFIYKMIRKKRIKLNSKRTDPKEMILAGDKIQLYLSQDTIDSFRAKKDKLSKSSNHIKVIYEDNNIILVHKEAGVLSQPSQAGESSLTDDIVNYLYNKGEYNPDEEMVFRPSICNRLDRNTIGIVIGAKNYKALKAVNEAIRLKNIDKYYRSLVVGTLKNNLKLEDYIVKNKDENKSYITKYETSESKKIQTDVKIIKANNQYSLLEVKLITGKSHQIRVHLASIGHPIVGDSKYGLKKVNKIFKEKFGLEHQFLIAYKLKFGNISGEMKYLNGMEFEDNIEESFANIENDIFRA
ncbi:RluA family pseudouridine synthase [Clostridiaceae bacterium M8S5]|nr:RluA family pseudouridine synthase [Clostridiaceae bacterium M8S5]